MRFARRYAPAMVKRGWGRVLFISSESALNIPREMIHYGMTKTAQLSVSHGLAMELAGTGVTVNTVLPGPTRTENTEKLRAERAKAAGMTVAELEKDFFVIVPSDLAPQALHISGGSSESRGISVRSGRFCDDRRSDAGRRRRGESDHVDAFALQFMLPWSSQSPNFASP